MSDLISRKAMLDKMIRHKSLFCINKFEYMTLSEIDKARADEIDNCIADLRNAPDAELETFEFCADGKNPCKEYDQEKHCCHRWTKVIRKTVEEVKNRGQWIPVTEALPEKKEMVLITNNKGHVRCGQYQRTFDDKNNWWWWKHNTLEEVLAWMPLPEPWKGE